MNPASLIPAVEAVPVHWVWFDVLLILTFTAHILFMNALLGSAAIGLFHFVRGNQALLKDVGQKLPPLLGLTINLGVPPLLFLQVNYGHFDYVSSVLMGGWWLSMVAALLAAYYGLYIFKFGKRRLGRTGKIAVMAASIACMVYTGFMLSNNVTLMLRPEYWPQYFEKAGGFLNLGDPVLYPRFLHFMVATVAVGGLFIALLGRWRSVEAHIGLGMRWFTGATLVNLGVGLWFLLTLPQPVFLAFMGENQLATLTFVASLVAAGFLLHAGFKGKPYTAAVWTVLTVLLMNVNRHWARAEFIEPWFDMNTVPVTGQFSSFFVFAGFLVLGIVAMVYMLKVYFRSQRGEG